jgi:hypothetical protein
VASVLSNFAVATNQGIIGVKALIVPKIVPRKSQVPVSRQIGDVPLSTKMDGLCVNQDLVPTRRVPGSLFFVRQPQRDGADIERRPASGDTFAFF